MKNTDKQAPWIALKNNICVRLLLPRVGNEYWKISTLNFPGSCSSVDACSMKYTMKRALVTSHQSLIQHPLKSEQKLPLTSVEIGPGPWYSCPNSVYFVPNVLILEQSFWQQKPLSQTWPVTLPAPHHKHLGRAVEPGRTEEGRKEKGCLQSKGHLPQAKGRSQARQRRGRGAKREWLLRKILVWVVN